MSTITGGVTLAQYALQANEPLVKSVSFSLIDNGSVMRDIPFVTDNSLMQRGVRWEGNLPSVSWAQLNEVPTATSGTPTPYQEQAYIIRNSINVDRRLVEDKNQIADPRGLQLAAYLRAVAYDFNNKFINNDPVAGDADAPTGLKYRIDNGTTFGVRSGNKINGGGVVMTTSLTAANANTFFEFLDQLLWSVDAPEGGAGVVIYTNDAMIRRMSFAARFMGTSGGFNTVQDQLGRSVMSYKGAQIRDIGYQSDQATRIITVTEPSDGSATTGSTYTSLYAVNYGMDHFFGWQFEGLQANDLGLLNDGVTYRTVVDWAGGVMNASNRSIARLYGVKYS